MQQDLFDDQNTKLNSISIQQTQLNAISLQGCAIGLILIEFHEFLSDAKLEINELVKK